MRPFSYARAADAGTAIALVRERPDGAFLAGGTVNRSRKQVTAGGCDG